MYLYNVIDCECANLSDVKYDIAFFASGYEARCTTIPKMFCKDNIFMPVVLGFKEDSLDAQRIENDNYFMKNWTDVIHITSSSDELEVYLQINKINIKNKEIIRILVDYSSMSRLWYAGILNWARFVAGPKEIHIDMLYTPAIHKEKLSPIVINDILSIPGCEGSATSLFKSVAVFGLGFDSLAALCVLDRLEPDIYYTYLASPTIFSDYPQSVYNKNKELIAGSNKTLELPLFSVEQTYVNLAEIVSLHKSEADIILIPMGPKPHVLSSILLSMKFGDVTCLRVSTIDGHKQNVESSGHIITTSIIFRSETPVCSR